VVVGKKKILDKLEEIEVLVRRNLEIVNKTLKEPPKRFRNRQNEGRRGHQN
jgi:hypothetical protein